MEIAFENLPASDAYRLLTSTILPRPIAWILTENADRSLNLAPFSYFALVSSRPATVAVSIGQRRDGSLKDTRANLLAERPAVVHLGNLPQADELNQSAAPLAPGESEVETLNLPLEPFAPGPLPRLAGAKVAFHAHYSQHVPLKSGTQDLILLELTKAYVEDAAVGEKSAETQLFGEIDPTALSPLTRLGNDDYAEMGRVFTLARPR